MKKIIFFVLYPIYLSSMQGPSTPSLKEICIKYLAKIEPSHEDFIDIIPQDLIDDIDEELYSISLAFLQREMMIFPLYMKYNLGPATNLDVVLFCNKSEYCARLHLGQKNCSILIMKDEVIKERYTWKSDGWVRAIIKADEFLPWELWELIPKEIIMNVAYSIRRG